MAQATVRVYGTESEAFTALDEFDHNAVELDLIRRGELDRAGIPAEAEQILAGWREIGYANDQDSGTHLEPTLDQIEAWLTAQYAFEQEAGRLPVELYEDNAGQLTLVHGDTAWTELEQAEANGATFGDDVQGIRDRDTDSWTTPRWNRADLAGDLTAASLVARTYLNGLAEETREILARPGRAAQRYLQLTDEQVSPI